MLKEKTRQFLEEFISELPDSYRETYKEIAEHAVSLGYTPKKTKTKNLALDFSKNKIKKTILKLEAHTNSNKHNPPGLRIKFYANNNYSDIFKKGIQNVIEEFDGKYTGCYGCGKCEDELEGYTYIYEDGRKVFRCGLELISIPNFSKNSVGEIKKLLVGQDEYFMKKLRIGS